ncbi:hypothetical protein [Spiroplasma endosymbiont of Stenodema calcarata]|uniref:hypothetical protein n=1 Tax=Spiroplasma endosymbiont of Stenodema calcarata TaxID=3139328 RepID=UPI003CCB5E3F
MNNTKNLYIVFYTDNVLYFNQAKVVKIFTNQTEVNKYLLTKVNLNGKKIVKDNKWIVKVYAYVGSNDRYEYSKWETGQFKNEIGNCVHCYEYFLRENNANMCEKCLGQVKQGLKECEVCHTFFNPVGAKFISNGDVFPSLACIACSETLIKNLQITIK